jgi:ribonuclease HII
MRASRPSRRFESAWRRRGCALIAGVDEAGRGCLAGPVTAAALILPARPPRGIDDSKRLTHRQREALFHALETSGARFAWASADPEEIDRLNIREASFLAMRRAVAALAEPPGAVLVDGFLIPHFPLPQQALVRGDSRCLSIAAASIVAKVARDRLMVELDEQYPAYGLAQHKGYPTAEHLRALRRHGPSPIHRRTFGPVRCLIELSLFEG